MHVVALCSIVTANHIAIEIGWYGLLDPLTTAAVQVSVLDRQVDYRSELIRGCIDILHGTGVQATWKQYLDTTLRCTDNVRAFLK